MSDNASDLVERLEAASAFPDSLMAQAWREIASLRAQLAAAEALAQKAEQAFNAAIEDWRADEVQLAAARKALEEAEAETIERCAKFIESGAGMADLIDQDDLNEQARLLRTLTPGADK